MDVFTVGNVLSVGIWRDGEAGMLAGGYESVPARNGCLVVVLISGGCFDFCWLSCGCPVMPGAS